MNLNFRNETSTSRLRFPLQENEFQSLPWPFSQYFVSNTFSTKYFPILFSWVDMLKGWFYFSLVCCKFLYASVCGIVIFRNIGSSRFKIYLMLLDSCPFKCLIRFLFGELKANSSAHFICLDIHSIQLHL